MCTIISLCLIIYGAITKDSLLIVAAGLFAIGAEIEASHTKEKEDE